MLEEIDEFLNEWMPKLGAIARAGFGSALEVRMKSPGQVVTDFDVRIEEQVAAEIRARWPDHALVGEEGGRRPGSGEFTWWIDPIDGTMNFVRGIPLFAVSIGVARHGRPVAGHVFDPLHEEHFRARAGGGAWLNERRISVSGLERLIDGNAHLEVTPGDAFLQRPAWLGRMHAACAKTRKLGALSLELAYVAAGRAELVAAGKSEPLCWWDICAGWALIEEAGGIVVDLARAPIREASTELVAGPPRLVDQFLALLDSPGR